MAISGSRLVSPSSPVTQSAQAAPTRSVAAAQPVSASAPPATVSAPQPSQQAAAPVSADAAMQEAHQAVNQAPIRNGDGPVIASVPQPSEATGSGSPPQGKFGPVLTPDQFDSMSVGEIVGFYTENTSVKPHRENSGLDEDDADDARDLAEEIGGGALEAVSEFVNNIPLIGAFKAGREASNSNEAADLASDLGQENSAIAHRTAATASAVTAGLSATGLSLSGAGSVSSGIAVAARQVAKEVGLSPEQVIQRDKNAIKTIENHHVKQDPKANYKPNLAIGEFKSRILRGEEGVRQAASPMRKLGNWISGS